MHDPGCTPKPQITARSIILMLLCRVANILIVNYISKPYVTALKSRNSTPNRT